MSLETYLRAMPKVELHVHMEGAIQPETLLTLARRNGKPLPFDTVEALREWVRFEDFPHFVEVYVAITNCLTTVADIELIAQEFLAGQAAQNVVHSEVTYTPYTVWQLTGIPFTEQIAAINRARAWAEDVHGVTMVLVTDIAREVTVEKGHVTADWAIEYFGRGVDAFGLGGYEVGHPPEKHTAPYARARAAGLPSVPHAGETEGPASIWGALRELKAQRIGHGVRCLEDPALVDELRARQIPLEVCPSSNVCLGVVERLAAHPLPQLIEAGLYVTINSDDPPLFDTSLNDEYVRCAEAFGFDAATMEQLSLNALRASLLPAARRSELERQFLRDFARLRAEHQV
jgi:adenosine deaminase